MSGHTVHLNCDKPPAIVELELSRRMLRRAATGRYHGAIDDFLNLVDDLVYAADLAGDSAQLYLEVHFKED